MSKSPTFSPCESPLPMQPMLGPTHGPYSWRRSRRSTRGPLRSSSVAACTARRARRASICDPGPIHALPASASWHYAARMNASNRVHTKATTTYLQKLLDELPGGIPPKPPYRFDYPVRLPDGRVLVLPLRALPEGDRAVASLIANQASFGVIAALAESMIHLARAAKVDVVIGMPTLGLTFAPLVAQGL